MAGHVSGYARWSMIDHTTPGAVHTGFGVSHLAADGRVQVHVHSFEESFYVLDGTLTMRLGDETTELPAGSFVCVPPGVVHTFSNPTAVPVRFLNFNTPAGWENYMRDLAVVLAKGTPNQEEIGEVASRYDFRVA